MGINNNIFLIIISFFFLENCNNPKNDNKMKSNNKVSLTKSFYGTTKDNKNIDLYSFKNSNGMEIFFLKHSCNLIK